MGLVPYKSDDLIPKPEEVQTALTHRELPTRLSAALERAWFEDLSIQPLSVAARHRGGDTGPETRILRIHEVKHSSDIHQSLHLLNMQNVISSLRDGSHSLIYGVRGEGRDVKLYMGVRHFSAATSASTEEFYQILDQALRSNYPGIELSDDPLYLEEYGADLIKPIQVGGFLRGVTGIPSLKGQDYSDFFAQSIDRLVDALRGETYTLLIVAEPIAGQHLIEFTARARRLSEEIHRWVRITLSKSHGKQMGGSYTDSQTTSAGLGLMVLAPLFGPSISHSVQRGTTTTESESTGATIGQEALNKTAEYCEQVLDHHIERIQRGRNLGFWNTGVYLASNSESTLFRAQGVARSLYAGQQTHFEPLRITDLTREGSAREALACMRNPQLAVADAQLHPFGSLFESLGTPLTTEELSMLISLPRREVPGLRLVPVADFGLNPPSTGNLEIGRVMYRGEKLEDSPVCITADSLAKHTFVSGITGAGKTNTCMVLLRAALDQGKPFLVIEPAKTEYRSLLADRQLSRPAQVFTLGNERGSPFRINPFEFEEGFNLLTHIDLLKAVFNAAFPMYASMPYILEDAIQKVYGDRGWDVVHSVNVHIENDPEADPRDYLPTLSDLHAQIDPVVKSKGYDARLTHDLTAALKTRIQSLLFGGKGMMLDTQRSVSFDAILSSPTILELQEIGDDDEKAFVMALLLIRLYEYCRQNRQDARGKLQHLTLVEEAHRLLKNIPASISLEAGNTRGKAVEMFADILAEVREYGEGFVIVDQIPSKLIPDVVKNTNLKIIHRLVAEDDRASVGNAVGLSPEQKEHLVRLRPGEAIVHNSETYTPLLVKVNSADKDRLKDKLQQDEQTLVSQSVQNLRDTAGDDFRRWPACHTCRAPCTYLSSKVQPERINGPAFLSFFGSLLFSEPEIVLEKWEELDTQARNRLRDRYDHEHWREHADGILSCYLALQVRRATAIYYSYYRLHARARHRALVALERRTMAQISTLIYNRRMSAPLSQLDSIRETFRMDMAQAPASARSGCRFCQRRCKFGILVQLHPQMRKDRRPAFAQAFAREVKGALERTELRGELGRTRLTIRTAMEFAERNTSRLAALPRDEQSHLAYCFLANMTTNSRALQSFQEALKQGIP